MDTYIRIKAVKPPQQDLLIGMYDQFEPLGAAQGLPPLLSETRREWIGRALQQSMNLAAFSPTGEAIGHCFLVADKPGSAELAVFVRQEWRGRGIGRALVTAALDYGSAACLQRVWGMTSSENKAVLCLVTSCGFRQKRSVCFEVELELDLSDRRVADGCPEFAGEAR